MTIPDTAPATLYDLATCVDLLAASLAGGVPLADALTRVAQVSPQRLADDLRTVSAALAWGVDDDAAWAEVDPAWAPVGAALALARALGLPPVRLLRDAADAIRAGEDARLEQAAARVGVLLVLPLGLAFLPAFVLLTVVPVVVGLLRDALPTVT